MRNRYPFLFLWKEQGFDKFPTIPFNEIINGYKQKFWEHIKNPDKIPLQEILSTEDPNIIDNFEDALNKRFAAKMHIAIAQPDETQNARTNKDIDFDKELNRLLKEWIFEDTRKMIEAQWIKWGRLVEEAMSRVIKGESRKHALRELGNKILPLTKGGPSLVTENQKRTLKGIYIELKNCIKEIRHHIYIPLKADDSGNPWGEDYTEDIIKLIPDVTDIFDKSELHYLNSKPSIAETAAEIIVDRLSKCIKTNIKSGRYLRDLLEGVPVFFP